MVAALLIFSCGGQTSDDKADAGTSSDSPLDVATDTAADVGVFNGCTASDYVNLSSSTAMRIVLVGVTYSPRCVVVRTGQSVVFKGDVKGHGMATDAAGSPFAGYAIVGDEAHVSFPEEGYFPYYDETNKASTGVVRAIP